MVFDSLQNAAVYYGLSKRIEKGLKYLQQNDFTKIDTGKYQIEGEEIYAIVDKYNSRPREKGKWEAHKKYIDIQFVADGAEKIGFGKMNDMYVLETYNNKKDIMFLEGSGNFVKVEKDCFAIFFPDDIHMPGIAIDNSIPVKKVVVKVKL